MATFERALSGVATFAFLAGCSGATFSLQPAQIAARGESNAHGTVTRFVPGPAVLGPIAVSSVDPGAGYYSEAAKRKAVLFVADVSNNQVLIFPANVLHPKSNGKITQGISAPTGLATDAAGALYVVNDGGNSLEVFPKGKTTPSLTITTGLSGPYGVAVDSKGTVYVSNLSSASVTAYKKGQSAPFETITQGLSNPVGLGVDAKDNLYIADDSLNAIFEVTPGSTKTTSLGLTGLAGPLDAQFYSDGNLYVTNFAAPNVAVYAKGATSPSRVITDGIVQPVLFGFDAQGVLFVSNQSGTIAAYKPKKSMPFETITSVARPDGIASNPKLTL